MKSAQHVGDEQRESGSVIYSEMPDMPPGVTVSVIDRTIRIRLRGQVSLGTSFEVMSLIASDPAILAGWPVLVDLTLLEFSPPHSDDLRVFAGNLGSLRAQYCGRFAIATATRLHYGLARMLSMFAEFKGITMTVFRDLGGAECWLETGA